MVSKKKNLTIRYTILETLQKMCGFKKLGKLWFLKKILYFNYATYMSILMDNPKFPSAQLLYKELLPFTTGN